MIVSCKLEGGKGAWLLVVVCSAFAVYCKSCEYQALVLVLKLVSSSATEHGAAQNLLPPAPRPAPCTLLHPAPCTQHPVASSTYDRSSTPTSTVGMRDL